MKGEIRDKLLDRNKEIIDELEESISKVYFNLRAILVCSYDNVEEMKKDIDYALDDLCEIKNSLY